MIEKPDTSCSHGTPNWMTCGHCLMRVEPKPREVLEAQSEDEVKTLPQRRTGV
jgi:hypothetical protein